MSRPFRKIIYFLIALGGLAVVAYLVMSTLWFRHVVEGRVIAKVESVTGGRVEVRGFNFRPLIFQITFHEFVLHGTEPTSAPPLFAAETLVMGINPTALFREDVILRTLDWDNAEVHVRTNSDGSNNLPGPGMSSHGENTLNDILNLSIGRITFLHTNIFLNDQQMPLDVTARDVAFQLHGNLLHHYQGDFSSSQATAEGTRWLLPAGSVAAQFQFDRTALTLDSLTWRGSGLDASCSLKLQTTPAMQATVTFSAQGDYPVLAKAFRFQNAGTGKVALQGAATYDKNKWSLQGRAVGRQLVIPSPIFNPGRLDVTANYSGNWDHMTISNLKISALGGAAQGTGEISIAGSLPLFVLHTRVQGMDMAETILSFPGLHTISTHLPPSSSMQGSLSATWKGRLNDFKSQFDLKFNPKNKSVAGSVPIGGSAIGTATLDHGLQVDFQNAMFQTPHSSLTAQGTAGEGGSNLSVQLASSDFEEWRRLAEYLVQATEPIPLELRSQATFSGTVTGPITATDIRGRVEAGAFKYRGTTWDAFSGTVGATQSYFEVTDGHLQQGSSKLAIDASAHLINWVLARDEPAHLAASARNSSIEGLQTTLGLSYPMKGDLTGQISLDGTPANLVGAGQFHINHGQILQVPFDSFAAKVRVMGSVWNLDGIQIAKGKSQLTGQAQYTTSDRSFSIELHGRDFLSTDLQSLAQTQNFDRAFQEIQTSLSSFDLRGHGTPENPVFNSALDLHNVIMHGKPIGDLHAQLDWQEQKLQMQLTSQGAGGGVRLSGEAQTTGDWPAELNGEYTNFRADPWIRLVSGSKFNALVSGTGTLHIKGPLKDSNKLQIQAQTTSLKVNVADMAWSNGDPVELHYAGGVLTASPFQMRGPSTNLQVEGAIHFGNPALLSVSAHGNSDNALLSLLDPAIHATGHSEVNLSLNGSPAQPLLHGALQVHDLNLAYGDFPFHLSGLNGEIQLEGDRATAKSLRGQVGGGVATLSGFLTFAQTPRFDFQASLDQVRVQYPADFTSLLNGNLSLVGSTEGGRLEGDLTVRQMFASEDFNVLSLLAQVNAPGGIPPTIAASSLASKIRLDIRVSSDPDVRLETHDLRLVADVDLNLQGSIENPVELGTIHILSGEAVIRGNRYLLDRGDVTMANPFRTQPLLDMQAHTRIQRYDLTMDISGPIDQMKIAYRTDPPLPTSDILSLLALGYVRNTGELASTNQSFSNLGATALLSEALSSQTTSRIQRLFGVSRIKIDPNVGDPANISGTRVTIEQQVSRDLTITYATNTGSTQQRVIQFEWALSDRISLIGVRDQNGIVGAEIIFRRRFK